MSRGPLNDIREFETKNLTWLQVNVHIHPGGGESSLPPGRYFHAAEVFFNFLNLKFRMIIISFFSTSYSMSTRSVEFMFTEVSELKIS